MAEKGRKPPMPSPGPEGGRPFHDLMSGPGSGRSSINGSMRMGAASPNREGASRFGSLVQGPRSPPPRGLLVHNNHSRMAELAEAYRMVAGQQQGFGAKELGELMRSVGMHPSDDEVKDLVRGFSQRGDGNISFSEFAMLMTGTVELDEVEQLRAAFHVLDKDGKGWVTPGQFTELFATMGERSSPEECEEMLKFADPQDSGKVDYNMFLATLAWRIQT